MMRFGRSKVHRILKDWEVETPLLLEWNKKYKSNFCCGFPRILGIDLNHMLKQVKSFKVGKFKNRMLWENMGQPIFSKAIDLF